MSDRLLGVLWVGAYIGLMLAMIGDYGNVQPEYTVDAKLILTGLVMGAWLIGAGYLIGKEEEG